jgi:hypothetical protein
MSKSKNKVKGQIQKAEQKVIKDVCIGYPCYDGRAETNAMQTIMQALYSKDICVGAVQYLNGDSLVTRARNKVVHNFLKTDKEYLMFIDSDILFQATDINRLRAHNKTIVGGVYFKKKLPYSAVCNRSIEDHGQLNVMQEAGTGFLMIKRSVFEDIMKMAPEYFYKNESDEDEGRYYDFFRVGIVNGRYLSEDYYFCHLARLAGHKIWLDTQLYVKHVGRAEYPFKDNDLLMGASYLLRQYATSAELDKKIVQSILDAVHHQVDHRDWVIKDGKLYATGTTKIEDKND